METTFTPRLTDLVAYSTLCTDAKILPSKTVVDEQSAFEHGWNLGWSASASGWVGNDAAQITARYRRALPIELQPAFTDGYWAYRNETAPGMVFPA